MQAKSRAEQAQGIYSQARFFLPLMTKTSCSPPSPPPPPEGRDMDGKQLYFILEEFHEGGPPTRPPPNHPSSHSNLNVTPRPTPRPRRHDPATAGAALADAMGPTRRSLTPTANASPTSKLVRDNAVGVASRNPHTSSSDHHAANRESGQDQPAASPTLPAGGGLTVNSLNKAGRIGGQQPTI